MSFTWNHHIHIKSVFQYLGLGLSEKSFSNAFSPLRTVLRVSRIHPKLLSVSGLCVGLQMFDKTTLSKLFTSSIQGQTSKPVMSLPSHRFTLWANQQLSLQRQLRLLVHSWIQLSLKKMKISVRQCRPLDGDIELGRISDSWFLYWPRIYTHS